MFEGCDGNQNRFENREGCELSCKMSQEEKNAFLRLPKQCIQPLDYGTGCEQTPAQKWYFDTEMKLCYPFEYTGCGPDLSNRFESSEECTNQCVDNLKRYYNPGGAQQHQQQQHQNYHHQPTTTSVASEVGSSRDETENADSSSFSEATPSYTFSTRVVETTTVAGNMHIKPHI